MTTRKRLNDLGFKGRKIVSEKVFQGSTKDDFEGYYQALTYAKSQGYVAGPLQRDDPVACAKCMEYVAKWRNIAREEYPKVEALLIPLGDVRNDSILFVELEVVK
jgi:hypothetical protein